MRRTLASAVLFLATQAALFPQLARSGAPTDRVRTMLEEVMTIQTDPGLQGSDSRQRRRAAIEKVIGGSFDFQAMSKQALGSQWQELDAAGKTEFRSIFHALFIDSYTRMVLDFLGRERIAYRSEEAVEGRETVRTAILRPNEEISVDYTLAPAEGGLLVNDVAIDGVSIVQNYQRAFARVIKTGSYSDLLAKMRLQQKAIEKNSD